MAVKQNKWCSCEKLCHANSSMHYVRCASKIAKERGKGTLQFNTVIGGIRCIHPCGCVAGSWVRYWMAAGAQLLNFSSLLLQTAAWELVQQWNEFQRNAAVSYSVIIGVGIRGRRTLLWEMRLTCFTAPALHFSSSFLSDQRWSVRASTLGSSQFHWGHSRPALPLAIGALTHLKEKIWGSNTLKNEATNPPGAYSERGN